MPGVAVGDRAALARAVLARAEERTGATRWMRPTPSPALVGPLAPVAPVLPAPDASGDVQPVVPALAGLLPSGGLDRGAAMVVGGSTALVLALVAEASRSGSWIGLVALPRVGLLAAHQMGLDLERVVLVPTPGPDAPTVMAALLDGVDVVVVGEVALDDADRRRVSARARERGVVLLSTTPWTGARVVLTVTGSRWAGLGRGHGRLRERRLTVQGGGRGSAARGWQVEVTLPVGRLARRADRQLVEHAYQADARRADRRPVEHAHQADAHRAGVVRPLWDDRRVG